MAMGQDSRHESPGSSAQGFKKKKKKFNKETAGAAFSSED